MRRTSEFGIENELVPEVGDKVYVGSSYYMSHGEDDFEGGLATITEVTHGISAGKDTPCVALAERPGWSYNWRFMAEEQDKLQERFGELVAHEDPDDRPEFNRWD